jgi:hypothetical protein
VASNVDSVGSDTFVAGSLMLGAGLGDNEQAETRLRSVAISNRSQRLRFRLCLTKSIHPARLSRTDVSSEKLVDRAAKIARQVQSFFQVPALRCKSPKRNKALEASCAARATMVTCFNHPAAQRVFRLRRLLWFPRSCLFENNILPGRRSFLQPDHNPPPP